MNVVQRLVERNLDTSTRIPQNVLYDPHITIQLLAKAAPCMIYARLNQVPAKKLDKAFHLARSNRRFSLLAKTL